MHVLKRLQTGLQRHIAVEHYRGAEKVIYNIECRNDILVDYTRLKSLISMIKDKVKDLIVHMPLYKYKG